MFQNSFSRLSFVLLVPVSTSLLQNLCHMLSHKFYVFIASPRTILSITRWRLAYLHLNFLFYERVRVRPSFCRQQILTARTRHYDSLITLLLNGTALARVDRDLWVWKSVCETTVLDVLLLLIHQHYLSCSLVAAAGWASYLVLKEFLCQFSTIIKFLKVSGFLYGW